MKVFHFRPYTLHLARYELTRGSMTLSLPRIAMEILILLVERRGDLLTRQEIAARIWPGADPEDVFQSINTAINRIRSTLRDEATNPRYVQTVIGKGYRFVATVEEMDLLEDFPSLPASLTVDAVNVEAPSEAAGFDGPVSLLPPPSAYVAPADGPTLEPATAAVTPASTSSAFANLRAGRRWRWVALVALALTVVAAFAFRDRFSAVPAERGAFKLVQFSTNGGDDPVTAAAISPDGSLIAYADAHGITLRELSGAVRSLRMPGLIDVKRIEWFPDGRHIVVSATASATHTPQVWWISTGDDAPHLIRDRAELGVPSPDGSQVAFTTTNDASVTTFWIADPYGHNEVRVNVADQGDLFPVLLWSADARKLIAGEVSSASTTAKPHPGTTGKESGSTHRLVVLDIQSHVETAAVDGITLNAACLWGKSSLLFAGGVNGTRYTGLWRVDLNPETGTPLAAPVQIQLVDHGLALSRTADGTVVAAVFTKRQPDVYVATLAQPGPGLTDIKRITSDPMQDYPQAWTPDSKAVLFEANESMTAGSAFHIYKQAVDGPSQMEPLVSDPMVQVMPQVSPDGKWILFASKSKWLSGEPYALYRVPTAGGAPLKIEIGGQLDEYRCPLSRKACVLRETEGHTAYHYYALDPVLGKGRLLCSTPWTESLVWSWSVSPDGTQIALPVLDPAKPRIRVLACAGPQTTPSTREIPVKISQQLMEVTWAADSQGWFVSAAAVPEGVDLFYVRQDGRATFLRQDLPLWGVPSPDGRKLAFVGETVNSNVWLLR